VGFGPLAGSAAALVRRMQLRTTPPDETNPIAVPRGVDFDSSDAQSSSGAYGEDSFCR
jgi:hypothetical protein